MADNTTELEVLDEIVDVLGGTSGQYETVVPVLKDILALLGGGGGGSGYNPSLSVGRADALTGADETAQWAQRVSTGSGAATVRSVQGAAEVQDGELVPVQIAGIRSTTAQGGELDSVEWDTFTLRGAGVVGDMLYSDHVETRVGVVDLGTLTWTYDTSGTVPFFRSKLPNDYAAPTTSGIDNIECGKYEAGTSVTKSWWSSNERDKQVRPIYGQNYNVGVQDSSYTDAATFKAAMDGVLLFYVLATPTTTPISPALPMTYRVEQGGTERIIVPEGEISAAPIITVAEGESAADVVMDALACIAAPDGPTATANHAQNTYLTMGGKLYKVTTAIASGEQIVSGTNVTETTVMAELIALTQ